MKNVRSTVSLLLFVLVAHNLIQAQDNFFEESTGLPGDHLNLPAVLDLFKEAKSIAEFEKALNTQKNQVNNLDLDQDGEIDYIRIEDRMDDAAHAIVMQVQIQENEAQDIAVIEIEKTGEGEAVIQIVGDEDIYGEEIIVEPYEEEDKGKGPSFEEDRIRLVVNVWFWPSVRYIYRPSYVVYTSPWRWHHYPRWWSPWRPLAWSGYHHHHRHHHRHYHFTHTHRVLHAHRIYTPRRTTSVVVRSKHQKSVAAYRARPEVTQRAALKKSTTVTKTGPRGGSVTATRTTSAGAAKSRRGQVVAGKKTNTKVAAEGPRGKQVGVQKSKTQVYTKRGNSQMAGEKTTVDKNYKKANGASASSAKTVKKGVKRKGRNTAAGKSTSKTVKVKGKRGNKAVKKTTTKKAVKRRR